MFLNEGKSHLFCSAKNTVAFFNRSRSSLRRRLSLRSRSFSFTKSRSGAGGKLSDEDFWIHLLSVENPMPRSEATCLRVSPFVNAMRTASRRNSSLRLAAKVVLLDDYYSIQGRGTKLWQVHFEHILFVCLAS